MLKDNHPILKKFHAQQEAEKHKRSLRRKQLMTAIEWILITLAIGGFLCLTKYVSFQ